ncbi:FGGY family carbohydrate kinase [Cumulibacter soli]|uniref:FGGY family carbohydrate kinase n=1 Tax=Cumulibacter soli TaxID=2546344 RepID=UPI001068B2B1|nr:glycerol kinase [Cumulibacter soli]
MPVLAIDAGTTGVTALVIDEHGAVTARGYREFPQLFPRPGWVEHDPESIWGAMLAACRAALDAAEQPPTSIGITNQRETVVLWDRATFAAPRPAIVWQDRRSAAICTELREAGHEARVRDLTGLRLDPYFSATKLMWIARNEPEVWAGVTSGRYAVGTVDSYLIARMTGGLHVTDVTNACRTLLYDTFAGQWSDELCDLFGAPRAALPEVTTSSGRVATTSVLSLDGSALPIAGIAGDQQAALFGQACFTPGSVKCTYGTGSFILANTGNDPVRSGSGLLTTLAWDLGDGPTFALEGSIFVTGAAVQWLRDGLGIIGNAAESEALARSVPDSGSVVFVPALTGLGAPDWDPLARGTILGLTRGTTRAHLCRATLDAIAFEVRDVIDLMTGETGLTLTSVSVDGGASENDLLCQLQADQLGCVVRRPQVTDTTAAGAGFLAGLASGVWGSMAEISAAWREDRAFEPVRGVRDDGRHEQWRDAVRRSLAWAED